MKVFLMNEKEDFASQYKIPKNETLLWQDLELNTLCEAMANGNDFIFKISQKTILTGIYNDIDTIIYRQEIVRDCINNSTVIRELYQIAVDAVESKKKHWFFFNHTTASIILFSSITSMREFVGFLQQLKDLADNNYQNFTSRGFQRFFKMVQDELSDSYLQEILQHLAELDFPNGALLSTSLGKANKGTNYTLRRSTKRRRKWFHQIFPQKTPGYSFSIHPRDNAGIRMLSEIKEDGIKYVANILAQSADHVQSFFSMLQAELAFYVGCLNLYDKLTAISLSTSLPIPEAPTSRAHSFKGLYDVSLALTKNEAVIGNDAEAEGKNLFIITGANQGGKSTFLRSIGLSQLMMQCGMFVAADYFRANICNSIFTHYKREEDTAMKSGKLDEELSRMNDIVESITPNALILFNESFAATNEREGSEIARQIVSALIEKHLKVFFVTHLFEFAHNFYSENRTDAIYLRAERQDDATRTFKLTEGEPLQTSFGGDLYQQIFTKSKA